MILVVTEKLDLRFLLQHQGRFIQTARTATEALRYLRSNPSNLQGVVLDERLVNSKLVAGYCKSHAPGVQLVSWQIALRNSPFKVVREDPSTHPPGPRVRKLHGTRYVWEKQQPAAE